MSTPVSDLGFAGQYKITVRKADGEIKNETPWFSNLITDAGLNRMGIGNIFDRIYIGTGTAAPSVSDTALQNLFGYSTNRYIDDSGGDEDGALYSSPYYGWARRTFRFEIGEATGTFSEVGAGWSAGLFSRALITNSSGTPSSITIDADESVDITYELRLYPKLTDTSFSLNISGVNHSCTVRQSQAGTGNWYIADLFNYGILTSYRIAPFPGPLGAVTEMPQPGYSEYGSRTATYDAYVSGNLYADFSVSFPLSDGNVENGIGAILFLQNRPTAGCIQMGFNPKIDKNESNKLNMKFRLSWSRYTG